MRHVTFRGFGAGCLRDAATLRRVRECAGNHLAHSAGTPLETGSDGIWDFQPSLASLDWRHAMRLRFQFRLHETYLRQRGDAFDLRQRETRADRAILWKDADQLSAE